MTYFLTFLLVVSLFFLIKKQLVIKRQKRNYMQLELEKGQVHTLLKNVTFDKTLDAEIAVLEYFMKQNPKDEGTEDVLIYNSLAKHFGNQQKQRL